MGAKDWRAASSAQWASKNPKAEIRRPKQIRNPSPSGTSQSQGRWRYIVGCPKQAGLYCGRPRRETGWWAFVRVFGDTPFLRVAAVAIDPRWNPKEHRGIKAFDDWLFSPVNLPKASPLEEEDRLEQWLERLAKAHEGVLAVVNDLAFPGYLRPELAEAALTLASVAKRLETMHRVPDGFEAMVARRGISIGDGERREWLGSRKK